MLSTKGFILRKTDMGEADRSYTVYTEKFGKKQLLVKGARKIQSKLSSHLLEFAEVSLDFVDGKYRGERIIGVNLDRNFRFIRNDLRKIAIGNFILDFLDNFIRWDQPDLEIYKLVRDILETINRENDIRQAYFSANIFIWKILIRSGYKPELNKCSICGISDFQNPYLNGAKGEILCRKCGIKKNALPILKASLDYLKGKAKLAANLKEIINIIKQFRILHLDRPLKSEVWVDKLFL